MSMIERSAHSTATVVSSQWHVIAEIQLTFFLGWMRKNVVWNGREGSGRHCEAIGNRALGGIVLIVCLLKVLSLEHMTRVPALNLTRRGTRHLPLTACGALKIAVTQHEHKT